MMHMFQSATLKLTAWYLGIIMLISLLFSVAIYQVNFYEVTVRLENLQRGLVEVNGIPLANSSLRQAQADQAALQLLNALVLINFIVLLAGGGASYLLARRTLKPIEQAHESQSRFTSDASHELRTPLTAMKTEIEVMLRDKKLDPTEAREQLESNLEEVEKLISLSEMLLNLSRLDYDRLEKRRVLLAPLVTQTLKRFPREKSRFVLTLRKDAAVYGNKAAMAELIFILVDNALKYSPAGSDITLKAFQQKTQSGFAITNSGEGIAPSDIPHIFDRFYRSDASRTKNARTGFGLGLAIAKKIVDVHGGEIHVLSSPDATTFTFLIPARAPRAKLQR